MDEVGKKFLVDVHYEILGQTPFTIGKIHVDQKNPFVPRVSVISIPVYPLDIRSFGPTKFWTLESGEYSDYDNAKFIFSDRSLFKETGILLLDNSLAKRDLGYSPRWDVFKSVEKTIKWYRKVHVNQLSALDCCIKDIEEYEKILFSKLLIV